MILTTDQILSRLQEEKPLSIIRIGDGEGMALNCSKNLETYKLFNEAVLKRQMGYYPPMDQVFDIRDNLIKAYSNCDIIGIPMHTQQTNAHWNNVKTILDENVSKHTENYCSIDVHYNFLNAGFFETLLQNKEVFNYISCRNIDKDLSRKFDIELINRYQIAPEAKFTSGYKGDNHYPDQFNKVQRWMDVVGAKGKLLLVGAGVIGKIYCNWWRDRGGIAFDIGSVLDDWAGKITRGANRGLDTEGSKNKL